MGHFRYTMKELKATSNKELIKQIITERKADCTNYYSPLYKRLQQLEAWVDENMSDEEVQK